MTNKLDEVIENVRKLAESNPDYVYHMSEDSERCTYIKDGKGDCIVGQALVAVGAPIEALEALDSCVSPYSASDASLEILVFEDKDSERDKLMWLDEVQGNQDIGISWGSSVERADRALGLAPDLRV